MISKLKLILLCPVPEDQKPITEYIGLKENSLTNWTTLSTRNYNLKCLKQFGVIFTLLSICTFQQSEFILDWILQNLRVTINILTVLSLIII